MAKDKAADSELNDVLAAIRRGIVDDPVLELDESLLDPGPESLEMTAPPRTLAGLARTAPDPVGDQTLDALVRSMLAPLLKDWLDANLPRIVGDAVDAATQAEIKRLTGRG